MRSVQQGEQTGLWMYVFMTARGVGPIKYQKHNNSLYQSYITST
jgi:hypothetical protein